MRLTFGLLHRTGFSYKNQKTTHLLPESNNKIIIIYLLQQTQPNYLKKDYSFITWGQQQ